MKKRIIICLLVIFCIASTIIFCKSSSHTKNDDEINCILSSMTTREKVSQMIMPTLRFWGKGTNAVGVTKLNDDLIKLLSDNSFGGIILFSDNIVDSNQTIELINSMQNANSNGNAKTKLFIGIDQEGGKVSRLNNSTQTIGNMGIGATAKPLYARESAKIISSELKSLGFNLDFAPVLDINNNPDNSVIGTRSFSDDPEIVSQFGKEFIKGIHDNEIITSIKHFMGHGNTSIDSHTNLPRINKSFDELKEVELKPFINTINDTDMVMIAHIQYPQVDNTQYTIQKTGEKIVLPASLSKKIITNILRGELGFDGVVITDAMDMDAIKKHFSQFESAMLAINAGIDIILMPFEITTNDEITYINNYIDGIVEMVNNGNIPIQRIDESVLRILKLKSKYELLNTSKSNENNNNVINKENNKNKEWEIELKSITLLKNDNNILPISNDKKVLILYSDNNQKKLIESAISMIDNKYNIQIRNYISVDDNDIDNLTKNVDIIIGVSNISNTNQLKPNLFDKIIKSNNKFVLLSSNLPYDVAKYYESDAIIVCYNSNGIPAGIYTIFGYNSPTGKIPVNIPKLSANLKFSNEILYTRSSGLTYR